jgi:signal transduction histidine kinase
MAYILAAILAFFIAFAVWGRRPAPGAAFLSFAMLAVAVWSASRFFEAIFVEQGYKILSSKFEYLGIATTGVLWLLFTADFTGRSRWATTTSIALLSIIPAITIAVAFTNDWHLLLWNSFTPNPGRPDILIYGHGPWFWVNAAYSYGMVMTGFVFLIQAVVGHHDVYSRQIAALIAGAIVPILGNLVYLTGISPITGLDPTPLSFAITGCIFMASIYRFQLFNIIPVARSILVDSLSDGVIVLDRHNRLTDINTAARQLLPEASRLTIGDDAGDILKNWPGFIFEGGAGLPIPPEILKVGERPHYLEIRVQLLYDRRGRITGRLIVLHNVTELKRVEEALRVSQREAENAKAELERSCNEEHQLRQKLESEMEQRDRYFRVLVHEMRNSLSAVIASSELLVDMPGNDDASAVARNIYRSAQSIDKRVAELLDLARGEMGMLKVEPKPTDMLHLLQEIAGETMPIAASHNQQLKLELPDTLAPVMADDARIRQVVLNLLNNSFKFTPSGGVITLKAGAGNQDEATVQVIDTGPGMDKETLAHLFDPYWQRAVQKGGEGGLGIGLALSKLLVELHSGRISAVSEPGRGTTVSFTLPMAK